MSEQFRANVPASVEVDGPGAAALEKKSALVTGANKGIGFEIARQLGKRDFIVWLGCRDEHRGEAAVAELRAMGVHAHSLVLDVTDEASVQQAAARLADDVSALDVLVNNAGINIGVPAKISVESLYDMAEMFAVNAFGVVRVTQALLPLLRKSSSARIVMMSSGLGSIAAAADMTSEMWVPGYAGYCASKAALNMFTVKFAKELLADGIKVNAADPGFTATDLNGHSGPRSVEQAATIAVELATLGPLGPTGGFFNDGHADRLGRYRW